MICDSRGGIAYLNELAELLLGLDGRLVRGRHLDAVLGLVDDQGDGFGWDRIIRLARGQALPERRQSCRLAWADGTEHRLHCEAFAVETLTALILVPEQTPWDDPEVLAYRASHDALTALPNRAALQERLALLHRSARVLAAPYGLLLLDLDHFKVINDRFGHAAGDQVLVAVGQRLKTLVRARDTVGRWGGEEFLCLLPHVDRTSAAEVAERVRSGIEGAPVEHNKRLIRVTASIGVVAYPSDGDDPDTLLAKADSALYESKRSGRNRVRCHTSASGNVFTLANLIESALANDQVHPAYQPVVDLGSGEIRGEEALARIQTPDGDWLAAAAFIPAAEQLNLVHRVDHRIIQYAINHCVARTLRADVPSALFVNFSADFLRHAELVAEILGTVMRQCSLCEPHLQGEKPLVVEITERQFLHDTAEAKQVLAPFIELGLRLAIDDFGTGHSSLHYLAELPVEFLKIEGGLIRRMRGERRVRDVVQGIQSLATDLGVITVAEGVEDRATLDLLREIGVDWGQGYLFGRPELEITPTGG
ncbi:MAG: putative bifunctional diguanylate cyclase/phosphodiesterase [Bdellovibrio bacteriovorus]